MKNYQYLKNVWSMTLHEKPFLPNCPYNGHRRNTPSRAGTTNLVPTILAPGDSHFITANMVLDSWS